MKTCLAISKAVGRPGVKIKNVNLSGEDCREIHILGDAPDIYSRQTSFFIFYSHSCFKFLRLSEFIIVRGVPPTVVVQMVVFMTISFLPACIPISLLFSILLTYGRLSSDSEVVALKASGLHLGHLLVPAIILSVFVAVTSAYVSFYAAPWGNRSFEILYTKLASTKAASYIQEGTFAEGFF